MFNISSQEIFIIALVILVIFGSQKLHDVARGLGETGKELKKAKKELTEALDETEEDINKTFDLSEKVEKVHKQSLKFSQSSNYKLPEVQEQKASETKDKNEPS